MDCSRPFNSRFLATALAFALVGMAVACDSGTQEPDAPQAEGEYGATDAAPAVEPTEAPVQTPRDGSIAAERFPTNLPEGITAEIPYNFPSSVPIYPGAQAAQGRGAELEGSPVSGVQLLSNDEPADIFGFYADQLPQNGFEITESKNDPMTSTITGTKDGCSTAVFIQKSPQGGSDIFVINECAMAEES